MRGPPARPAEAFGGLLHEVQSRRLFADGKHFVDMEPRRPPAEIIRDFEELGASTDAALLAFVRDAFEAPQAAPELLAPAVDPCPKAHIAGMWRRLSRPAVEPPPFSSALSLPAPHVVAGGRFREFYYWDSYFSMLGLLRDGQARLAQGLVDACLALIERFGHVPNGARTYYLGRSQPPVFHLMARLAPDQGEGARRRRLAAMVAEHRFWMSGAGGLAPGEAARRCVRLPDGNTLNRYWDDFDGPRDEAYAEDLETARTWPGDAAQLFRDLRAGAESGWDFSSRWLSDPNELGSIRTTSICPIDLNCLLWSLERTVAEEAASLGEMVQAEAFEIKRRVRGDAILRWHWSAREGRFGDLDRGLGALTPSLNAAILFPLFVGLAGPSQAAATARLTESLLLAPGGVRATTLESPQQWDRPNGWAPLQWIAVSGLERYGHGRLARSIAERWLATVRAHYGLAGVLLEKYDIEISGPGRGGEYPVQDGFGWTNGVVRELLARYG